MPLRRTTISKCFAIGLVLLAVPPFAAPPFATYDFSRNRHREVSDLGTSVHHDALLNRVASKLHLAGIPARIIFPPSLNRTEAPYLDPASPSHRRQSLHSILRL